MHISPSYSKYYDKMHIKIYSMLNYNYYFIQSIMSSAVSLRRLEALFIFLLFDILNSGITIIPTAAPIIAPAINFPRIDTLLLSQLTSNI